MSIMVGVGKGATAGVLIKNAEALERFEKIDTLVVDKTGTLTEGKPRVVAIVPAEGFDEIDGLVVGRRASSGRASTRWPPRSSPPRKSAASPCEPVTDFSSAHRQGRHRPDRRPAGRGRQCHATQRPRHRRRRP